LKPKEQALLAAQIGRVHIFRHRGDGTAKLIAIQKL
jgi:hypothetical protein